MHALQSKIDRLDALLDRRLADQEAEQVRADASLEEARRQRQRANAEARRQIAERTTTPSGRSEPRFRRRSMTKRHRGIAHGCSIALCAACRKGTNGPAPAPMICRPAAALDNIEQLIIEAAKAEGARPSVENLPARWDARFATPAGRYGPARSMVRHVKVSQVDGPRRSRSTAVAARFTTATAAKPFGKRGGECRTPTTSAPLASSVGLRMAVSSWCAALTTELGPSPAAA